MTSPIEFCIDLDGGKYTYVRYVGGHQIVMRYRESWNRDLTGDKFVAAMGYEIERLQKELVAAQAREAQLREALENERDAWCDTLQDAKERDDDWTSTFAEQRVAACERALAVPADGSALKARLKAERERCAKVCNDANKSAHPTNLASAIRNLGDE